MQTTKVKKLRLKPRFAIKIPRIDKKKQKLNRTAKKNANKTKKKSRAQPLKIVGVILAKLA